MSFAGSSGAACAVHPTDPAVATCTRCGNFMCDGCRGRVREDVCGTCEVIVGAYPMSRGSYDVSQALSYAWSRYKAEWTLPTLLMLVFFVVNGAFTVSANLLSASLATSGSVVPGVIAAHLVQLVGAVLQGVLLAGFFRVAVVALQGQTPSIAHVAQGMRRSGILVAMQLIGFFVGSVVGIPFGLAFESGAISATDTGMLCAIAGTGLVMSPVIIYVSLGIQSTGVETLIDPDVGFLDAVKRSWAVAEGARGDLFIAGLVGGLVVLGGLVACCVGVVPAAGVTMYLSTATYLALRDGVVPPPSRTFES